ncbi:MULTISPECIES: hypothetical protein [unclassified Microbacterium]|uniref:hypothetical protein n=1 Tax=unclassified Microbacterium TaxID=2609290 RepID=UPI000CFAF89E|nr:MULTISPECIES: hypothetical protein [unclassified Microbacterium]PQZ53512.1 hypothetical protein CQ032_15225 [Microbacterium sp. MYb43]PQZ75114.1 hypothetical protein CQ031_14575 [Microbacterium sp. MYb40]PRB19409.1 hypothetical protein CQ040_15875 [Microbacterium sp. MYb54]PRB24610.1 hypothetical protein CQ037_16380 [Microbacterium sp. MYb50]PRB63721.1 hypothetical protein CQ021_15985 [Microbacterium sp. MYb24]
MPKPTLLPVSKPAAYAYQFYAFPLSIIAQSPGSEQWLYSNYIQLAYDPRGQACHVPFCFYLNDYARSPWLSSHRVRREWFAGPRLLQNIADAVADGWYVYLMWDEWHVERRRYHREEMYPHDVLIHGFDPAAGTIQAFGYDERYQLSSLAIPVEQFEAASASLDENVDFETPMILYKPRDGSEYGVDVELVVRTLGEYVEGFNTSTHFAMETAPMERFYGVETYEPLADYLAGYLRGSIEYDIRHLQVLWEHKRLMAARMKHLASTFPALDDLLPEFNRLQRASLRLRNDLLRIEHLGHQRTLSPRDALLSLRDAEIPLLQRSMSILQA